MVWSQRNAFVRLPRCRITLLLFFLLLAILPAGTEVWGATYTVINTNNSGAGSLRQAIINANTNPGPDTINFNIPGCGLICSIPLASTLSLSGPNGSNTTIDGYSQPGAIPATATTPAVPKIEINGLAIANNNCFNITSSGNVIRGLAVNRCTANGIYISGTSATANRISGNLIGTNYNGFSNSPNTFAGVFIGTGASGNTIGGAEASERNLISGNRGSGIEISGAGTNDNIVSGNYIGTLPGGDFVLPNVQNGIHIYNGAQFNVIGGAAPERRNIISGNMDSGILMEGAETASNIIKGNYIGLSSQGLGGIGNKYFGILLQNGANHNVIGGENPGEGNTVSGNDVHGILLYDSPSNYLFGNFIGTSPDGGSARGNSDGILLIRSTGTVIGGDRPGLGNLISGNRECGIFLETDANTIQGNTIGLAADGLTPLPNQRGIEIIGSQNTIGGTLPAQRNIISGNLDHGIQLSGGAVDATNNVISGNYIGTDASGRTAVGNTTGIFLGPRAANNVIGGEAPGSANVISGNQFGVWLEGGPDICRFYTIRGNFIGTDYLGMNPLGNVHEGVYFSQVSQSNTVGPDNVIAYNGGNGVQVDTPTATRNFITRNRIFANGDRGIRLSNGANSSITPPVIQSTAFGSPNSIRIGVAACPNCAVQVFNSRVPDGEGEQFLGGGLADGAGAYTLALDGLAYPYLTATASDTRGTSEFSPVFTSTAFLLRLPLILR